jgi:hypothetical protein
MCIWHLHLLGHLIAIAGREDIFKPTIANESLYKTGNDNRVRVVNFTSKNLTVRSTMFSHHNFHKYTWMSPHGNTHNQINHILTYKECI